MALFHFGRYKRLDWKLNTADSKYFVFVIFFERGYIIYNWIVYFPKWVDMQYPLPLLYHIPSDGIKTKNTILPFYNGKSDCVYMNFTMRNLIVYDRKNYIYEFYF